MSGAPSRCVGARPAPDIEIAAGGADAAQRQHQRSNTGDDIDSGGGAQCLPEGEAAGGDIAAIRANPGARSSAGRDIGRSSGAAGVGIPPLGSLWGLGVGPGPAGYLPLAALDALRRADLVYTPRARSAAASVALQCLAGIELAPDKLREVEFDMEQSRPLLYRRYAQLADAIAAELRAGRNVAYLTIGDALTYSTYGYLLTALRERLPDLPHRTFPGITSYAAAAAALGWPLGEGKERVLILPCPETAPELRRDIETHDIVVLMKIGPRLGWVLDLLREMGIAERCAFARRIGLDGEMLASGVGQLQADEAMGYLATLLIRRNPNEER